MLARTVVRSQRPQSVKLSFGCSDDVAIFLNGKPVFASTNGHRSRATSSPGEVGFHDAVQLPLRTGLNEILLMVSDSVGGWGFMCHAEPALAPPIKRHELLTKVWETSADFAVPESVLYDSQREILYVSSFNRVGSTPPHQGATFRS